MRKIILLSLLAFNIVSCQEKKDYKLNNKTTMNKTPIIYGIDYDIQNYFQILINDDMVSQNFEDVKSSAFLPINEYLLSNKKTILKVKLFKTPQEKYITHDLYKNFSLKIMVCNNNLFEGFKLVQEIKIPEIKNETYIEYTYTLNVDSDKLNPIVGWNSSEDLIADKEVLLKEVQDYYLKVYNVLNSGSYNDYHKIIIKREQEVFWSYFNAPEIFEEQNNEKEKVEQAKGIMKPIDFSKYLIKFYGDGRLVTLEDENGDSPLYYENKDFKRIFGIVLHRPTPKASLEVIR